VFTADVTRRSFLALGNAAETGVSLHLVVEDKPRMQATKLAVNRILLYGVTLWEMLG